MPLLSFQAFNGNSVFMRHQNFFGRVTPLLNDQDKKDSTFHIEENWQIGNVVKLHPAIPTLLDFVLRHSNFEFLLQESDGSDQFNTDSSFTLVAGLANQDVGIDVNSHGLVSFQSVGFPDRFIMPRDSALVLETADNFLTQEAATWFVLPANFTF
jgi:hypothetical protein